MKLIDFILITLFLVLLFVSSGIHREQLHKEQMLVFDSIKLELKEVYEHIEFVDSMHYGKCNFDLKDGMELEVRLW